MAVNNHWMYQGRQYHQWFGHGTAPKETKEQATPASPGSLFDPLSIGQWLTYATGHVISAASKDKRSKWESRLSGTARDSLKAVIGVWYGARDLSRDTFHQRLLDPYTTDETADRFREAAKGIVEARTHGQLGEAGSALAVAAFKVGVDAWPRYLGDAERRAMAAVSQNAIPGVVKASADGLDMPRAVAGGVILGAIILYIRQKQEEAKKAGTRPVAAPPPQAPTIVEAAVPLPPPQDGETPVEVLKPGGQNVGERGNSSGVRILLGGESGARELFDRLTKGKGGKDITPAEHPGQVIRLPDGSIMGIRAISKSGPPTIDVKIPGLGVRELKFPGGSAP